MNKILSLKKEITFKNTIEEILSISMDNSLCLDELLVKGDFIVEGEYLNLSKRESFHFEIPYLGYLDDIYNTELATVKVDDFYYEIIEPNKLLLSIDILVDNLSERKLIEEILMTNDDELESDTFKREEPKEIIEEFLKEEEEEFELEDIGDTRDMLLFKDDYQDSYMTYKVYIVREGDTIDNILDKYKITLEQLNKYNVINEIKIGDKIIIPNEKNK